jgi:hypothetical protein
MNALAAHEPVDSTSKHLNHIKSVWEEVRGFKPVAGGPIVAAVAAYDSTSLRMLLPLRSDQNTFGNLVQKMVERQKFLTGNHQPTAHLLSLLHPEAF